MPLFYDTETSGMLDFKREPDAPGQPCLIQLAFILDDEDGNTLSEFQTLIKPHPGVTFEQGAIRVHGITPEDAETKGIDVRDALSSLQSAIAFLPETDYFVAHNDNFDTRIIRGTCARNGYEDLTKLREHKCTMLASTNVLKLPGRYPGKYKWPKLEQAYQVLVDVSGFENAHDAMVDTRACREVYYALKEKGQI